MHFMGAGAIDMRQRESGTAGAAYLQHPRGGDMARAAVAAAAGNMGAVSMPAATSAARTGRDGYADAAVARQCEREDCTVQPSYGKVWKKVSPQESSKLPKLPAAAAAAAATDGVGSTLPLLCRESGWLICVCGCVSYGFGE